MYRIIIECAGVEVKALWAKSNIYLLTAAGIAVALYMAFMWGDMPAGQKALGFFVVGITLHEWEECRFPGGFYDLMTKKLGIGDYTKEEADLSHGAVVIAIVFFAFVPFLLWEYAPWLAGIPAILGFFEAFIHIAGIKIHNLPRPYTPGMATALLCLLPSAIAVVMFATPGIGAGGWALAVVCFFAIFGCMEVLVWSAFGVDPLTIPGRMRGIIGK